ncbi:MAG: hypothetical protein NWQ54_01480, partial [Paraglaciecola sp.]|nr:hypothetical protein [Paraglaciecola sp.]
KIKFREYIGTASVYFIIKRYRKLFLNRHLNVPSYKTACHELILGFIRSHGADKVERIKSNIEIIHTIDYKVV